MSDISRTSDRHKTTEIYRRKMYLLRTYGNGFSARCVYCPKELTYDTLTVDRIIPGSHGGTYRRTNIRPACQPCNNRDGGEISAGKRLPLLLPYPITVIFPDHVPLDPGHPGLLGPGRIDTRKPRGIAPKHRSRISRQRTYGPPSRPERELRIDRLELASRTQAWLDDNADLSDDVTEAIAPMDPEAEARMEALRLKYMYTPSHI